MNAPQNVIAIVFDFDDTLTDDSTTKLLEHHGIDSQNFWKHDFDKLVKTGWDPTLGYLHLILQNIGRDKPLGMLSNENLRQFGKTLKLYRGLPALFKHLKKLAASHTPSNPHVEFYIVSGGIEEIIRGSKIAKHVDGICGCRFEETDGVISHVKNVVSFTEKTRYLFEISKNVVNSKRDTPYAVNTKVDQSALRVPLRNMIYVGDGLTDVPCFSLLQKSEGKGFGVFDPTKDGSPKKAWEQLVAPKRTTNLNSPKYARTDDLGALLIAAVESMCTEMDIQTKTA